MGFYVINFNFTHFMHKKRLGIGLGPTHLSLLPIITETGPRKKDHI